MKTALIGHTGFVGGNLKAQLAFDDLYNTSNIESIAGKSYDLIVSAGAPAVKWLANQKPMEDMMAIERLMKALQGVTAKRFVLISTVDVYPRPIGVDETTVVDLAACQPYGTNRLMLEGFVGMKWPDAVIVRLPGLFGPGLKKNVVYDFLNDNRLDLVHQDGILQYYDLAHIGRDVMRALDAGLRKVNFATEPVPTIDIARHVFGREFTNTLPLPGPRYDFHTIHAATFGGRGHYLSSKADVLAAMKRFVDAQRAAKA